MAQYFLSAANLRLLMVSASALTVIATVVFFLIFCFLDKKARIKAEKEQKERQEREEKARRELRPRSAQSVEGSIKSDDFSEDEHYKRFRHWGNLNLSERFATLPPGDKVLYAAIKKQFSGSGLTNFTTDICEVYFNGELPAARLIIYRGLIYLFLNIDPKTLDKDVYQLEDVSDEDGYEMLPTMIIIRESAQVEAIPALINRII